MSQNLSGMLWKSRLLNVAEIPIKKERKVEADTKYENLVFQRESSLFPSGTFQKSEAGTSQAISSFTTLSYRDDYRLTVPCSLCNQEICPSEFLIHKRKHKAMTTMGYTVIAGEKLERGILILKRRFLLSSIIAANSLNEKIKTSIDKAYEFLCMQDNPSYYTILSSSFNSSVHLKKTNNPVVNAVAICEDQNKTWKQVMEDRYVFRNRYGKKSNTCFFGLFDGQHGSTAAEFMAEELPKFLLDQLALFDFSYKLTKGEQSFINSFDTVFKEAYREQEYLFSSQVMSSTSCYDYEYIHRAFAKAFWRMDRVLRLGRKEVSNFYWSGCTAVACLLESDDHFGTSTSRKTASLPEDSEMKMEEQPSHFSNQSESNSGILHIANVGM
ncbi:protein phosphatase 2C-like domain-containing protein 1 [Macrotis lagotis]|uniref:protein phosphatase 2C-like domain-containing protein 1 n=1 Tax=Macrotis lagotis TaxID=92651 RepID=UPI003D694616